MGKLTQKIAIDRRDVIKKEFLPAIQEGVTEDTLFDVKSAKCGYPTVELERRMFAYLVGSNPDQEYSPDPKCAAQRAVAVLLRRSTRPRTSGKKSWRA